VYDEVLRRARVVLASGRSVVLDCSFRTQHDRVQASALAEALRLPFWFVECQATVELCRARLDERSRGASVSDGRPELLDDFVAHWEPVGDFALGRHLCVDTSRPLSDNLHLAAGVLPVWSSALPG
jgi:hypothetical protein